MNRKWAIGIIGLLVFIGALFIGIAVIILFNNRMGDPPEFPTPKPSPTTMPTPKPSGMVNTATPIPTQTSNTGTPTPQPSRTINDTTPTPDNLADRIRKAMPKGNVVYDPPAAMNLEDTKLVNLILGPTQTVEELVKMIPDKQDRQILNDNIQWYGYMQAEMTGTDFDITPVTSPKQLVSEQEMTKWSWSIKPKKPGKQKLFLTLYAVVDDGGVEKPLVIRPFDPKEIVVDVTLYQRAGLFLSTVGSHMEWVLTAIIGLIVPFAFWLWRRGKEKDNAEAINKTDSQDNIEPKKPKKTSKQKPRKK